MGWILIGIVIVVASMILWAADQPGHRRRKPSDQYDGPDRRADKTSVDFLDYPIFTSPKCKDCKRRRKVAGEPCDQPDCEPHSFDETDS